MFTVKIKKKFITFCISQRTKNVCVYLIFRDLACRNILVVNDSYVKITDFGLARMLPVRLLLPLCFIYLRKKDIFLKEDGTEYTMTSITSIPYKWYSLESLTKKRFTSLSDVWSFGILLWEMFTFGGIPYLTQVVINQHCFKRNLNGLMKLLFDL